jgi:thiol-disulfide isomerase/thioredoxin
MKRTKKAAIGFIFLALVAVGAYNIYVNQGSPQERELNRALGSGKPAVLYFHSAGCAACIEQEEILSAMEGEYKDEVAFIWADFAGNREMFKKYAGIVSSFPVVVVFDSDGTAVKRYSGLTGKEELEGALGLD